MYIFKLKTMNWPLRFELSRQKKEDGGKLCREKRPIILERNNNWIIRHGDFTPRNSGPQDRADARWIGEEDRKGT